jgi:hypothetical protein
VYDERLRRIIQLQGAFLRREAHELGYDDKAVQRAHRAGAWVRVHHGCYTFSDVWEAADLTERHRIRARAVLRTHDEGFVLSHQTSLLEHDVDHWGLDLERVQLTAPNGRSGRRTPAVCVHSGTVTPARTELVNGVPATVLSRALVETSCTHGIEVGVVSMDSALRKSLVTPDDLRRAYEEAGDWAGARQAGLAVRLADGRSDSVGESRCRFLMWHQGIPMPELQFDVHRSDGSLVGTTDFAWPEAGLLGEFDGKVKYGRLARDGESPADVVFREKRREEALCEITGWRMIRLSWSDLYVPRETAARIRRMLRHAA